MRWDANTQITQDLVSSNQRQWSFDPRVFETHDEHIDSFGLHVKSTMLLSKVKVFNTRYKIKRHLGDPNYTPQPREGQTKLIMLTVPALKELDRLNTAFIENLPPQHRTSVANGVIDVSLLTAISNAHL